MEHAVEPLLYDDSVIPQDGARLRSFQLEPLVLELDREIIAHSPKSLHGEYGVKILPLGFGERPVQVAFLRGGHAELRIKRGDENF